MGFKLYAKKDVVNCPKSQNELGTHNFVFTGERDKVRRKMICDYKCGEWKWNTSSKEKSRKVQRSITSNPGE